MRHLLANFNTTACCCSGGEAQTAVGEPGMGGSASRDPLPRAAAYQASHGSASYGSAPEELDLASNG